MILYTCDKATCIDFMPQMYAPSSESEQHVSRGTH